MIIALIINKNRPKVSMVIGKVNKTRIGFTIKFKILRTRATKIDFVIESTQTPGSTDERMITARAFSKSLKISFISIGFKLKKHRFKTVLLIYLNKIVSSQYKVL